MRVPLVFAFAVLLSAAQTATTYGGHKAWIIKGNGTTTVKTRLGGQQVTVVIHTWQVPVKAGPLVEHRPYPQCTYSQNPCSITDAMSVRLGDNTLWDGSGGIADLGDMHYLSISGVPTRLVLVITGGDGADSYHAHFIFDRQGLSERILYGLDLEHPYEVSRFYSINIGS